MAYLARYLNQPFSELLQLSPLDIAILSEETSKMVAAENGPVKK